MVRRWQVAVGMVVVGLVLVAAAVAVLSLRGQVEELKERVALLEHKVEWDYEHFEGKIVQVRDELESEIDYNWELIMELEEEVSELGG